VRRAAFSRAKMNEETLRARLEGLSPNEFAQVLMGLAENAKSEGLEQASNEVLQGRSDRARLQAELERQLVHERAWNSVPGNWPLKKRLAVLKYVGRCVERLDYSYLKEIKSPHLQEMVSEVGLGYDGYILRQMNKKYLNNKQ